MVEVFRTDVTSEERASELLAVIHDRLQGYRANFDLEDCDNILRVESKYGDVQSSDVIDLLRRHACRAEVLPEDVF